MSGEGAFQYVDISKYLDELNGTYQTGRSSFGDEVIKDGSRFDAMLHQYGQAISKAKRMGEANNYPELVPLVLTYEKQGGRSESNTHRRQNALPALSNNGQALIAAQIGGTISDGVGYPVLLPSGDINKFENHSEWEYDLRPEAIAQAWLDKNYLDPQIWTEDGNPVARECYRVVLNQSENLDEGESVEWKGEARGSEVLGSSMVERDEYGKILRKIAGIEVEEDEQTVVAKTQRSLIAQLPRQTLLDIIVDHVDDVSQPHFKPNEELIGIIHTEVGDPRDLDNWSEYESPEFEEEQ